MTFPSVEQWTAGASFDDGISARVVSQANRARRIAAPLAADFILHFHDSIVDYLEIPIDEFVSGDVTRQIRGIPFVDQSKLKIYRVVKFLRYRVIWLD